MDELTRRNMLRLVERLEREFERYREGIYSEDETWDYEGRELVRTLHELHDALRYATPVRHTCKMFAGMPCPYMP